MTVSQGAIDGTVVPDGHVYLGQLVTFDWHVTVAGTPTDAGTFTAAVVKPDGSSDTLTVTHAGTGHYTSTYTPATAGHYQWTVTTTGAAQDVTVGVLDVFDPNPPQEPALVGVLAPWVGPADVATTPAIVRYLADGHTITDGTLARAARAATELLYSLSGRQFPGVARTYCRPLPRPRGWDTRSWGAYTGFGYWDSYGVAGSYSMGYGAASAPAFGQHGATSYPPELPLNFPVRRIEAVKIDGTPIPANEYRVDDYRMLVRVLPTADATPTARAGWPATQHMTLPDTEDGTFSVTYWYGTGPGELGEFACATFAAELALSMVGADNRLPARMSALNRQGESVTVLDAKTALDDGLTGIPEVDAFIVSVNPKKLRRRGSVWSPDMGRNRTPTS